jgi:putative ABC transport system permease protein
MLRNHLKIALRHLWRNRLFTAINVLGLAIGLSATWIIFRIVSYEFAYDQQHPNKERVFRVVSRLNRAGQGSVNPGVPTGLIKAAQTAVAGVELVVPIVDEWLENVYIPQAIGKPKRFRNMQQAIATDGGYFDLFRYDWLAGTPVKALNRPNEVVLTRSRAELYFPGLSPTQVLGRSVNYLDTLAATVTGVVADPTSPGSFDNKELYSISTFPQQVDYTDWGSVSSGIQFYVRLADLVDPEQVQSQLNNVARRKTEAVTKVISHDSYLLQPLTDIHFGTEYSDDKRHANRAVMYGLMGLALFILLLAIINYINLASAQMPQRAREIGIRKALGSRTRSLIGQFMGETLIVTILALGLAFILTDTFLVLYANLLPEGSNAYVHWPHIGLFLLGLLAVVCLLSGWYPGWLITRFQPVAVLRGQTQLPSAPRLTLRKSLIVFQFVIAQVFIIGAIMMGQQLRYLLHSDMGFNQDAVVTMATPYSDLFNPADQTHRETFRSRLARLPGVSAVSLGSLPASQWRGSSTWFFAGKKGGISFSIDYKYVDTAFVGLYKMPLLAGRNIMPSDTIREFVINEATIKTMGLSRPQDAIGQFVRNTIGKLLPIVGVVRDFHTASFHNRIAPLALMMDRRNLNTVNLRLASKNPADWQATLKQVEQLWKQIYPDEPFAYEFYDQTIARFYEQEQTTARIINLATAVAILLSCLGLFGLATLTAYQRTKEIGIRKVLGASVAGIVAMLSNDFLKLVLIALVLASPLAWWAVDRWLENYAYKISISPWVFVGAGLLAVGIALLTVSFQSVRAAIANPVESLRTQ